MKSTCLLTVACTAFSLLATMPATAASVVNVINANLLLSTNVVDFENVAPTNHDSILTPAPGGVSFAERFNGQTRSDAGFFDELSDAASGPLTLVAGSAARNLYVMDYGTPSSRILAGLGPFPGTDNAGKPVPTFQNIGEGSIAILFASGLEQSEVGFDIISDIGEGQTTYGLAIVDFFQRDGSHLGRQSLNLSVGSVAFRLDAGAGSLIAGLSIFNNDPGGIGIDNVRYSIRNGGGNVPEPGSLLLAGLALVGLAATRRRKT